MDTAEAKTLLRLAAETARGIKLEFLNIREDCLVYLFMCDSCDEVDQGIRVDVSWEECGKRIRHSRSRCGSPAHALNMLYELGELRSLGAFVLVHPRMEDLNRAWFFLNSPEYHEATDIAFRHAL